MRTGKPAPWNSEEQVGRHVAVPDEHRIARRAEIVTAHDAWWADCDVTKERLGLSATEDAEDDASAALDELEQTIVDTMPSTLAGLAAKSRWASGEDKAPALRDRWTARIAADVIALAERGGAVS